MRYEKLIYDLRGDAHVDRWAPNHKITSNFFNFAITQENQYLLGNGAIFGDKKTKEKLGGGQVVLVGDVIETQFQSANNYNLGAALSLVLMVLILICLGVMNHFGADDSSDGGVIV